MAGVREAVERIREALNAHDADALAACFAEDYENTAPAHPARGFRGRDQGRRNFGQIFSFVPDFRADVVSAAYDNPIAFTEWEFTGTRKDGSPNHMCGAIVLGVKDDLVSWASFYMEPDDEGRENVDEAVRRQVVRQ